jgi:hypothetical protein
VVAFTTCRWSKRLASHCCPPLEGEAAEGCGVCGSMDSMAFCLRLGGSCAACSGAGGRHTPTRQGRRQQRVVGVTRVTPRWLRRLRARRLRPLPGNGCAVGVNAVAASAAPWRERCDTSSSPSAGGTRRERWAGWMHTASTTSGCISAEDGLSSICALLLDTRHLPAAPRRAVTAPDSPVASTEGQRGH